MKYLFLDASNLAETANVKAVLTPVVKCKGNPVLRPEFPWEGRSFSLANGVLYDPALKRYRMWYLVRDSFGIGPFRSALCYAESEDGLSWRKPFLGVVDYRGSSENNLVFCAPEGSAMSSACVLDQSGSEDGNRFRLLFWGRGIQSSVPGLCVADSKDGFHWDLRKGSPFFKDGTDAFRAAQNPTSRGIVVFQTEQMQVARFDRFFRDEHPGVMRFIGRRESLDLERWSERKGIVMPDQDDPSDLQFTALCGFPLGDSWIGFVTGLHTEDQTTEVSLVFSKDMRHWVRDAVMRTPFVPRGPQGSCDAGGVECAGAPVRGEGDRIYVFYTGYDAPRDVPGRIGGIGIARSRQDGYVALCAGESPGYALTQPVSVTGAHLFVNLDSIDGRVEVEIVDEEGKCLDEFSRKNSVSLTQDNLRCRILWKGAHDLSALRGGKVRLRFWLQDAKIYSYWFE